MYFEQTLNNKQQTTNNTKSIFCRSSRLSDSDKLIDSGESTIAFSGHEWLREAGA